MFLAWGKQASKHSLLQMMQPEITGASLVCLTAISQQGHLVSWKRPRRYYRQPRWIPLALDWKLTPKVSKFLTTHREKSGLHYRQCGTKTNWNPGTTAGWSSKAIARKSPSVATRLPSPVWSRTALVDTYITSEYKVNTGRSSTASITWQGLEGWAGLRGAVDRCVN